MESNFNICSELNWEMFWHFELTTKNDLVTNSSHRFMTNLQNQIPGGRITVILTCVCFLYYQ